MWSSSPASWVPRAGSLSSRVLTSHIPSHLSFTARITGSHFSSSRPLLLHAARVAHGTLHTAFVGCISSHRCCSAPWSGRTGRCGRAHARSPFGVRLCRAETTLIVYLSERVAFLKCVCFLRDSKFQVGQVKVSRAYAVQVASLPCRARSGATPQVCACSGAAPRAYPCVCHRPGSCASTSTFALTFSRGGFSQPSGGSASSSRSPSRGASQVNAWPRLLECMVCDMQLPDIRLGSGSDPLCSLNLNRT